MLRRSALVLPFLALGACSDPPQLPDSNLYVVLADGSNPLSGRSLTTARAFFVQDLAGSVEDFVESEIVGGTFDLRVPVQTYAAPILLRVELASVSGVELVGGSPSYYPAESSDLELLVGVPGTCAVVTQTVLATPRASLGAALLGSYAVLAGGDAEGGASSAKLDAIDLLTYTRYGVTDAATTLSASRVVPIDRTRSLVVSEERAPFIWRLFSSDVNAGRPVPTLHVGAATADAVVAAPGHGAAVVGGGDDLTPSGRMSWISASTESVTTLDLAAALPHRVAAFAQNGLWIVSRGDGDAMLEQVAPNGTTATVRIAAIPDGVRLGGSLVFSADGTAGLLFGGVDDMGMIRTDTVRFTGCPDACSASAGPTWSLAREGAFVDPSGLVVGGDAGAGPLTTVERVVFGPLGASFEPFASLTTARAQAAAVRLPTGPLLVFGGLGASGVLGSTEVCFPPPASP